ncbi:peptidase T [Clostridium botulinum]|uniref:Peptidase T n=3 Tax=Clostridium botulinum TaxID=1491 RepID=PEPT_CLOBH|nr:peptidase T [Clostridium botulinum]A5HYY2.1 RecName: Full=Peptidase T; AltName: Full=Aminotripeptidase; Short=Tripeptidase; AltName: Full=Tripeptide aminopeptidase [Clostridium botulinum A str. Hall]A7FPG2.1 RecName: Full=Peptidase T; AltName: Full=Aminotripeptidase; Short=Tripeptidase; AltName: Full=Tripeptide aminopeptidase [Clostridium botulinum A str. ATCC 19397]KRU24222.1 peptidase T [Clostridium sporogenes]ABS33071.1 peptidase T [Clostridium botulinum A str. ATCC 19397]ABS38409.1 pept
MKDVLERFLGYIKVDTQSSEESDTVPTTKTQLEFAKKLGEELKAIGLKDVSVDENGYVMATLESNIDKKVPTIGFIAHMDTSPDLSGTNINPRIVEKYDGQDIVLNKEKNIVLKINEFPEILEYKGQDIVVTDGNTLLGADDKAGIAEIITAMEYLINHPEIKHGTIKVGFTPDEEVGKGADHFDVKKFGADLAYTLDGGGIGELECETFNAAKAKVIIEGRNVHPGSAKNKMTNAVLVANKFINMLPENEVPERTEGYEGFFHLLSVKSEVETAELNYIIRDFDRKKFEERKEQIKEVGKKINEEYNKEIVCVKVEDQYYNMKEKIDEVKYVVDIAYDAMKAIDIEPILVPIRGGTDGSRLSFMGLPTPNLFAGGHNFHGRFEFVPVLSMEKAAELVVKIAELYANR